MVHEPSFFTFTLQDVRRLRSRSVAVLVNLSSADSNKKFARIGMVVLRSTTPCVAVSSFRRSNLLTVISIVVPCASAASAIYLPLRTALLLLLTLYQKKINQNQ